MDTRTTDETILLRDAIAQVLGASTDPMTSVQIAECYAVRSLGVDANRVSKTLFALNKRQTKIFPLARIRYGGKGQAQWAYYNPEVCQPLKVAAPVNSVNPEPVGSEVTEPTDQAAFAFNPVELVQPSAPEVSVVPGVRSITISVGGVTIKIELTA